MLKLIFWFLLAVNVVVFATTLHDVNTSKTSVSSQNTDPVAQEKIRVLSVSMLSSDSLQKKEEEPLTTTCIEIGDFSVDDANKFENAIPFPSEKMHRITVNTASSYMVHIPPSKSLKDAERKIAELKANGITHYFLISEGKFRHAISLGIFKTEASAQKQLAELKKRGIHDVAIATRGKVIQRVAFRINGVDDHQLDQVDKQLDAYSYITKKDCQTADEHMP